jgi:flagellar FliL protein
MGDEERVEEAPKKGKGKLLLILIILVVLLGVGGGAAYFFLFKKKAPAPQQAAPTPQPIAPPVATAPVATSGVPAAPQFFYKLDTFIVNLADEGGSRYLKVDMTLALSNKEVEKEIEKKLPVIRDAIITVISNKYYKDIATPAGKLALKREIMARINILLTKGKVIDIYFTDFVVQ